MLRAAVEFFLVGFDAPSTIAFIGVISIRVLWRVGQSHLIAALDGRDLLHEGLALLHLFYFERLYAS